MNVKDAVAKRIQNLCAENNISLNELAVQSGLTPSTVYSIMDSKRRDISIITIKRICDGLSIELDVFFSDDLFTGLEPDIKWFISSLLGVIFLFTLINFIVCKSIYFIIYVFIFYH